MAAADLASVKDHLRISVTTYDAQLQMFLNGVTTAIEAEVGPLTIRSFVEHISTRAFALVLSYRPVVSIVSINPDLTTWPSYGPADVAFDGPAGSVWRTDLGTLAGNWTVTYTAGNATVGDDVKLAQLLVVQDLWEATRGGTRRPGMGASDPADSMNTYEMRRRVREILRGPALGGSGIA